MIYFDPIEFNGTIHKKASGHSYERFKDLALHYNDILEVSYVNDVMPYVTKKITIGNFNQIIIRNIVIILVLTLIGALSAGLYARHKRITFFTAESSVILNIKVTQTDYKNAAMMAEKGMMHSYEEILNNQETMKKAEKYLPANFTPSNSSTVPSRIETFPSFKTSAFRKSSFTCVSVNGLFLKYDSL